MSDKPKVNFNKYVPGEESVVYGNYPEICPDMIKAYHYHERLVEALHGANKALSVHQGENSYWVTEISKLLNELEVTNES